MHSRNETANNLPHWIKVPTGGCTPPNMVASDISTPSLPTPQLPPAPPPVAQPIRPAPVAPHPAVPVPAVPSMSLPHPSRLLPQPYLLPVQFAHPNQINWKAVAAAAAPGAVIPHVQMASAYRIGRYTPAERKVRLDRYRAKRAQRNYNRRVKYDCRKMIADKRHRVQGRFVKREEEVAIAAKKALQAANSNALGAHSSADEDRIDDMRHTSDDIVDLSGAFSSAPAINSSVPTRTLLDARDLQHSPRSADGDDPVSPNSHFLAVASGLPSLHDDDKIGDIRSGPFA